MLVLVDLQHDEVRTGVEHEIWAISHAFSAVHELVVRQIVETSRFQHVSYPVLFCVLEGEAGSRIAVGAQSSSQDVQEAA
jgi:hypothetical protein